MKKMITVKWYDPDTTDSIMLAAQAYGLKITSREKADNPNEIYVSLYGPKENIERFKSDFDDDIIEPFESKKELSDEEYLDWLSDNLRQFGCLFIPTYPTEDETEA